MTVQEIRLRVFEALCSNKEIHPTMIAHTAEKACEWILREDASAAPITVNVSAEMDGAALGGLISRIVAEHNKATIQARPATSDLELVKLNAQASILIKAQDEFKTGSAGWGKIQDILNQVDKEIERIESGKM